MPEPQNLKNHARMDPPFHFFVLPILLLNLIFAVYVTIHDWPSHPRLHPWWIVMSLALMMLAVKTRMYALKAQDRVIRLEERLRMAALLPAEEYAQASALTEGQFVALRFASDAELPALVRRTLQENLEPKQIKAAIENWRSDYFRI